jgi:hypothetical protein
MSGNAPDTPEFASAIVRAIEVTARSSDSCRPIGAANVAVVMSLYKHEDFFVYGFC